ncbi:MAG: WYL domain-containing protein [Deferrisomatales bacterium]|nr:WYL domain-containing protein [Deferrisomatales bacterium]
MPPSNDRDETRATRALRLYEDLLYSGQPRYLVDLCGKYGWHKTTIQGAIDSIDQAVGGIESGHGTRNRIWYRLRTSGLRPRPAIEPDAVRMLLACRDMVAHLLPEETRAELDEAIAKTTVLLPDMNERDLAVVHTSRSVPRGTVDYSAFREVIDKLSQAIAARHLCRIRYKVPHRPEPREHVIAPLSLLAHRDSLYLRCRHAWPDGALKPDYGPMLLVVHRMLALEELQRTFECTETAEPDQFGIMNYETVRVRVAFRGWAATRVRERTWSADQTMEEDDSGALILEFTARGTPEVIGWVMAFGGEAEVLEPQDLRRHIAEELARTRDIYSDPSTTG